MKRKILLVDDDELILESIKASLESRNYDVLTAKNGEEALSIYKKKTIPLVLTDIQMPIMDGVKLVNNLLEFEEKPLILVQSIASDMNLIIELMQKGVYDYLLKTYSLSELIHRVDKAYEVSELRILNANLEKEREVRMAHLLNWNEWKETRLKESQDRIDGNLIGSIRTSFSQGTGLGSLLSVIGLIEKKAKETETGFEISKPMMEYLLENAKNARRIIEVLEEIDKIQSSPLELQSFSISEIHRFLSSIPKELSKYLSFKNQTIVMCENKFSNFKQKIKMNSSYIQKAMKELLFNALKFSIPESKVYIIMEIKPKALYISVFNTPIRDEETYGISPAYSNIIFEPFFRISKLVFESIPTLDFGLGLTMVDKIIRKHRGKIKAGNLLSYLDTDSSGNPGTLVNFEIELPIDEE